MPSWKVRSNSSERAKSWITPARQSAEAVTSMVKPQVPSSFPPQDRAHDLVRGRAIGVPIASVGRASRRAGSKQRVGRGAPGPFALELGLDADDLGAQRLD